MLPKIIILFLVGLSFVFLYNSKNRITQEKTYPIITTTQIKQIDELIAYNIPSNWNIVKSNDLYASYEFYSPDYADDGGRPLITNGAKIVLSRTKVDNDVTDLKDAANLEEKTEFKEVKIANKSGLNAFSCWDNCYDGYYFLNGNYLWRIYFECAPGCNTKEEVERNIHKKELDLFLNSLILK